MPHFRVLGPLEVLDDDGQLIDLGGRQRRLIVALLLVAEGRPVPLDRIVDAVWGDDVPPTAVNTVQSQISRLRRRMPDLDLQWEDGGYRLTVDPDDVDARRFERAADEGRRLLDEGRAGEASEILAEAVGLWRGATLQDMADVDALAGFATRLDERRLAVEEDRFEAVLRSGRHAMLIGRLRAAVDEHPLRERLRVQLALALYRSDRQSDALRTIDEGRTVLREQLGIDPGRPLRDLEAAILAHDPALDLAPAPEPRPAAVAPAASQPEPVAWASVNPLAGPRLTGRDSELAALFATFESAAQGPRFIVIEGEPGIGKSRLADELGSLAAQRGALVAWGRSDESGAAPGLWPWLAPLRALAASLDEVEPVVAQLLTGQGTAAEGQADAVQFERFEAIHRLIEAVAARRPVVVLLDDLQWADATSIELLSYLVGRLGRGAVIVMTLRQRDVGRTDAVADVLSAIARSPGSRHLLLARLDSAATAELVADVAERTLDNALAEGILARAEGNPFYAIELARLLANARGPSDVPATVSDVIRRRLARLSPATRELIDIAAVQGRDLDLGVLARVVGREVIDVVDDLDPAVAQRVLVAGADRPDVLRFSHALVREVVLQDLTPIQRARLHCRIADAIEAGEVGSDDVELLAEHLWRATPVGVGLRAADMLDRAAEVALSRVSYATAEQLLERSTQLWRSAGSDESHLERELLATYRLLEVARARRYFQAAVSDATLRRVKELCERLGREDMLLDVLWFEWSALATAARLSEQQHSIRPIFELAEVDHNPAAQFLGYQLTGVYHWELGNIDEARRRFETAVPLIEYFADGRSLRAEQALVTHMFRLNTQLATGLSEADEVFAEYDGFLGASSDRSLVVSVCGFAATTATTVARWDQVAHFADYAASVDPHEQFTFWVGQSKMHRGLVLVHAGEIERGVELFRDGDDTYLTIGGRSGLPCFRAGVALNAALHGCVDLAVEWAEAARSMIEATRERWNESMVLVAEAAAAVVQGHRQQAVDLIRRAVDVATQQGAPTWARSAAASGAALGIET